MEPRGPTQTHKRQYTHIYIRSSCLNSRTQWKHYCKVTLLKSSLCVRPELAFEYANDSAGSNLDVGSINVKYLILKPGSQWHNYTYHTRLYTMTHTHTSMLTAAFTQIPIQTCQSDGSHHGTLWLNELKWMRKATEGEQRMILFVAWLSYKRFVKSIGKRHTHTHLFEQLLYQVTASLQDDPMVTDSWRKTHTRDWNTEPFVLLTDSLFFENILHIYAPNSVYNVWSPELWSSNSVRKKQAMMVLMQNKRPRLK